MKLLDAFQKLGWNSCITKTKDGWVKSVGFKLDDVEAICTAKRDGKEGLILVFENHDVFIEGVCFADFCLGLSGFGAQQLEYQKQQDFERNKETL